MQQRLLATTALVAAAFLATQAAAATSTFGVTGPGVSASIALTYGPNPEAGDPPGSFVVTGITGSYSNARLGITDAAITAIVPRMQASPEPTNLLAPASFGFFPIVNGPLKPNNLPAPGFSFDNLFYPGGSPQTASDYPFFGGLFDIYGIVFRIQGGLAVNLWSDGNLDFGPVTYGSAVTDGINVLDYVFAGVSVVPEPGSLALVGAGLLGLMGWRRRSH